MSQSIIETALSQFFRTTISQSVTGWAAAQQEQGDKVALFRAYEAGDHPANMSSEMREMLRIGANNAGVANQFQEFNNNHMPKIIHAMGSRLTVSDMVLEEEAANTWLSELLAQNEFDILQSDVYQSALRDGDVYMLVTWDNEEQRVVWTPEPAYDGVSGMVVLYQERKMVAALKIWRLLQDDNDESDVLYVTVYYPDRVEKFMSRSGGQLTPRPNTQGKHVEHYKQNIGVPVVHFRNRGARYDDYGQSEIENAIPLQNALNRALVSMVASAELGAFPIRYAVGFKPPLALSPGMIWQISPEKPLEPEQKIDLGTLEQGEIQPYIDEAQFLKHEIYEVTSTPRPDSASDTASGESLKQREVELLGKIRAFQNRARSSWRKAVQLSVMLQDIYGRRQYDVTGLQIHWQSAELRDDNAIIRTALEEFKAGAIDHRTYLETVAPVRGWSDEKIEAILANTGEQRANDAARAIAALPTFERFELGEVA